MPQSEQQDNQADSLLKSYQREKNEVRIRTQYKNPSETHINKVGNLQLTLPVSVLKHYKQQQQQQWQMGKQTTKLLWPTGA